MSALILHIFIYGFLGWGLEIIFTAIKSSIKDRSWKLEGFTTLWVFPLYASAVILFEPLHDFLVVSNIPWFGRGIIYVVGIYVIEFIAGLLLVAIIKKHPWRYSGRYTFKGYINFLYAPAWFIFGLLLEQIHTFLLVLDKSL